jgi:ABC-type uncharacterized transport system permease subunit
MDVLLTIGFWTSVLTGALRLAAPIGLAALGETVSQLSGVLNLGLEGYMIVGALTALYVGAETTWWLGVMAGMAAGIALAASMALLSVRGRANQVVVGFGITILGIGLTGFIHKVNTPLGDIPRQVDRLGPVAVPLLSDIPVLGRILFSHNPITWMAIVLVPVVWWVLARTSWGLAVRACGEDPDAAAARGVNVIRVRTAAVLVAGALAGLGGAGLTVALLGLFLPNMTAGRGFIAIAVVLLGRWRPFGVAGGALLFGTVAALSLRLQTILSDAVPTEAIDALPYVVTLIVLVIGSRTQHMPHALAQTYVPET